MYFCLKINIYYELKSDDKNILKLLEFYFLYDKLSQKLNSVKIDVISIQNLEQGIINCLQEAKGKNMIYIDKRSIYFNCIELDDKIFLNISKYGKNSKLKTIIFGSVLKSNYYFNHRIDLSSLKDTESSKMSDFV